MSRPRDEGPRARAYAARLARGWALLDDAEARGDDAEWVRLILHWERLLQEYVAAADAWRAGERTDATPAGER